MEIEPSRDIGPACGCKTKGIIGGGDGIHDHAAFIYFTNVLGLDADTVPVGVRISVCLVADTVRLQLGEHVFKAAIHRLNIRILLVVAILEMPVDFKGLDSRGRWRSII